MKETKCMLLKDRANMKKLHTTRLQLYDILEKAKQYCLLETLKRSVVARSSGQREG